MKQVVIGAGEVGRALAEVLDCTAVDMHSDNLRIAEGFEADVLHITFPWQIGNFVEEVQRYEEMYQPDFVVVHSTVPTDTCDTHGWVHSPVRGKHPNLVEGLYGFAKHYGGSEAAEVAGKLSGYFSNYVVHEFAATTEAAKMFELVHYGLEIVMVKNIEAYCARMDLDFDEVYTQFADTYNEGWLELQRPEYMKPVLKRMPGPIGGHCVVQGAEMLQKHCNDLMAQVVIAVNKELS